MAKLYRPTIKRVKRNDNHIAQLFEGNSDTPIYETKEYPPSSDIYFDYDNITFLVRPEAIENGENSIFVSIGSLKKSI